MQAEREKEGDRERGREREGEREREREREGRTDGQTDWRRDMETAKTEQTLRATDQRDNDIHMFISHVPCGQKFCLRAVSSDYTSLNCRHSNPS